MRIIETKLYLFEELSEKAKAKALDERRHCEVMDRKWWEGVYENAEQVGIKITSFDIDRGQTITGKVEWAMGSVIREIMEKHGPDCRTYKTVVEWDKRLKKLGVVYTLTEDEDKRADIEDDIEELGNEFLTAILEDYWQMLYDEYEYLTSDEVVKDCIIANGWEFTEDGKKA